MSHVLILDWNQFALFVFHLWYWNWNKFSVLSVVLVANECLGDTLTSHRGLLGPRKEAAGTACDRLSPTCSNQSRCSTNKIIISLKSERPIRPKISCCSVQTDAGPPLTWWCVCAALAFELLWRHARLDLLCNAISSKWKGADQNILLIPRIRTRGEQRSFSSRSKSEMTLKPSWLHKTDFFTFHFKFEHELWICFCEIKVATNQFVAPDSC